MCEVRVLVRVREDHVAGRASGLPRSLVASSKPPDSRLVPLDNSTVHLGGFEDLHDVRSHFPHSSGACGVGRNGDPYSVWPPGSRLSFLVASLKADRVQRRPLETAGFEQVEDLGSDVVPNLSEVLIEDRTSDLASELAGMFAGFPHGKGIGFKVGTPHELGRVAREAAVIQVALVFGDQVGRDDVGVIRDDVGFLREGVGTARFGVILVDVGRVSFSSGPGSVFSTQYLERVAGDACCGKRKLHDELAGRQGEKGLTIKQSGVRPHFLNEILDLRRGTYEVVEESSIDKRVYHIE